MTMRRRLLKTIYPLFMALQGRFGRRKILANEQHAAAPVSFYDLKVVLNNGDEVPMSNWKGKKILLVNTASDCGFTAQYADLQQLYDQFGEQLVIIAFPSNDFGRQEKGTNEDIAGFCSQNYGISFPLAQKSIVVPVAGQNPVFQWLTHPGQNGWNDQVPTWNFSKYLVNEHGVLTHYFDPGISPLSNTIVEQIRK